ncbi:MAG TPA: radical SAM protein [Mycobacterium sp.]|nr:radical SAM protein [Mycobacterium sp.]
MHLTLVDNLVFPAERDLQFLDTHPHLGLLSLAAVASTAGHDVTIFDPKRELLHGDLDYNADLYEQAADALLRGRPDVIGFTTLGCSFLFVLRVGRAIRRREPDIPLLLGGPHATMLARPILERYGTFDVVVRHEAERTLVPILSRLDKRDFGDIPGVTWQWPGGVEETSGRPRIDDLDSLPWLDYDFYPMDKLALDLLRVEAGRGCPFACTFCSTAGFFQRRYRLKSPARLVAEMDMLGDRYGAREFKLDHDMFTVNRSKVKAFCDSVSDRRYKWRVSARVDCVDPELLEQMADAGCVGLYFGIETGSARMQKISCKRLDLDLVDPILDTCERLGIETTTSFITGYPEETSEDQRATIDLLGTCFTRAAAACLPQLHILTPEPGTPLFDTYRDELAFDGYATPFNASLLGTHDRDDVLAAPDIFATYHYYPATLDRNRHVAVVDTVDLLRKLSRPLLAALIRRHNSSLADLVLALVDFPGTTPRAADLEHYARRHFGDGDPLTSAVRFELFNDRTTSRTTADNRNETGSIDPAAAYAVPPDAEILADVHTYEEVQLWLDAAENPATFSRSSYVWLEDRKKMTRLDPPVVGLLEMFGTGRCTADVARMLGLSESDSGFHNAVSDLVAAGLLVHRSALVSA